MAVFCGKDFEPEDLIVVDHGVPVVGHMVKDKEAFLKGLEGVSYAVYSPGDEQYETFMDWLAECDR